MLNAVMSLGRRNRSMSKILIWDIPTRLVHWAFAVSVTAALATSLLVDHDHPLFPLRMLFGIVALFLLCLRGVLGLAGSRYARFASYPVACTPERQNRPLLRPVWNARR